MNAVATTEETARFAPPRLPWHPVIEERFGSIGANKASWKALTEAVFPGAKSVDSVVMALSYCAARKLDPFKRPVHIVPMWDSQSKQMVETVWPGISEIRTTAFRTGQYAGCDEVEFGPMVERTFTGTVGKRGYEKEVTIKVIFPEWGRINVYRSLSGKVCKFVSPKVYWLESYGRLGASDVPNDMWAKRPSGQLEKCVEAAGLRKAFPEEVGNDYTAEEMHGQALLSDASHATQIEGSSAPPPAAAVSGPTAPPKPAQPAPAAQSVEEAEIVEVPSPAAGGGAEQPKEQQHPEYAQEEPFDADAWLEEVQAHFHGAKTISDVDDVHATFEDTATDLPSIERQRYEDMHAGAVDRIKAAEQAQTEAAQDAVNTGEAPATRYFIHPESSSYFITDDGSRPEGDRLVEEVNREQFEAFKTTMDARGALALADQSEAQDDDVEFEGDDDQDAAQEQTAAYLYVTKLRAMIADPETPFPTIGRHWNATKAERQEWLNAGLMSKETRDALLAELDARKKAGAAPQDDGPAAPPPPSNGPGAPSAPANDEDPITKLDREFRASLEACADKVQVAALAAETLVARNKFSGTPQHKAWSDLVAAKRKSFAGVTG